MVWWTPLVYKYKVNGVVNIIMIMTSMAMEENSTKNCNQGVYNPIKADFKIQLTRIPFGSA